MTPYSVAGRVRVSVVINDGGSKRSICYDIVIFTFTESIFANHYLRRPVSVQSCMIYSRSLGAIRSCITCSVHLRLLIKVRPRANLVNSLRWIRPHICRPRARVGIHIGPTGIRFAGRLYDTSRNDGAECLQAILLGGYRHVKYHCAAAAAVGGGPFTDVPSEIGANFGPEIACAISAGETHYPLVSN